jgi:murein DD-endopeptidase MepM/ murein hydrolase activator NlpD
MAEDQIILLPVVDYFKWVRASQKYVLKFAVTITPDPVKAGLKSVVTIPVTPNGFPDKGDICDWLRARFPDLTIDAIPANTPQEFQLELDQRVVNDNRYGSSSGSEGEPKEIELHWPTDYAVVTQRFGAHPENYAGWGLPGHEGLDIRALTNTNIYACADGEVYEIEEQPNVHPYGKHIRIKHAGGYRTVYAHLNSILVQVGGLVVAKQLIGKADSTGNSQGSHLHLSLKKDGATARKETEYYADLIDPTPFMIFPDNVVYLS